MLVATGTDWVHDDLVYVLPQLESRRLDLPAQNGPKVLEPGGRELANVR